MRLQLSILLLAALAVPPVAAGPVVIDPDLQTVDTPRLRLVFDYDRPEWVRTVVFKDYHPSRDLAGEDGRGLECWGQDRRGVDSPGFIRNDQIEEHSWQVLQSSGQDAAVRIWSRTTNQPSVTTTYYFNGLFPWFVVERTIHFSELPDTASYQAYAPRVSFLNYYRALRWRDVTGAYLQRGYCFGGCATPSWDGRWLEHISLSTSTGDFSVAQIYPDTLPPGTMLARGSGPESLAGWVSPIAPAGLHDQDVTTRVMIAFSTVTGDTATLDSLWRKFNSQTEWTLDAAPAPPPALRLAISPNPAAGPSRLAWTLPAAGRARLEVLDLSGRRVATLHDGELPAGAHARAWDGRDDAGRRAPPGVYLARLVTPGAVATARLVRVR